MADNKIQLDNDAKELYSKLEGIDVRELDGLAPLDANLLAQSLREEEKQYDTWRLLLGKLVHTLSAYFLTMNSSAGADKEDAVLNRLEKIFTEIDKSSGQSNPILIRYRGSATNPNIPQKVDYEIICGHIVLDLAVVHHLIKRTGFTASPLPDQMMKAFEVFWDQGMNNLFLKLPKAAPEFQQMRIALRILSRYVKACSTGSRITYKINGKQVSLPPVQNERNLPDPNLTMLAGLNGLKPQTVTQLAKKVDAWMRRSKDHVSLNLHPSVYSAIFSINKFREKLIASPIEINNLKWMMVESDKEVVSEEMAQVARIVIDSSNGSQVNAAQVLKSVYGNDFQRINSHEVVERLKLTSGLLTTIEKKPKDRHIEGEVLDNVEKRLDRVHDEVYDDITIDGKEVTAKSADDKTLIGKVHSKIAGLVSFHKSRSVAKKKMKAIVHRVVDFDDQDYETLAKDFDVSIKESKELIEMLKSCFDNQGNFQKGTFGKILPEFSRYERRIFEFLWHYLKETLNQKDRTAFLNSLQLLVDRLKQPKKSISVLLEDLCESPEKVKFADRKAFMLANRLVRKYTHELISYQITPEDVLLVEEGLDKDVAGYAAWKIDRSQDKFFQKIKTMHQRLMGALNASESETTPMDAQYLIAQEREAYIFLSLVGGNTARSVVLSAVKEFGNMESEIYKLRKSQTHLADLLQLLKVAVRGLGRIGKSEDIYLLDHLKNKAAELIGLGKAVSHEELIHQILEWIAVSKRNIAKKS
ncbi:MAG: hypothetical protein PVI06_19795 [Desulfobacterales bacterium]|jgi:hypothetical protein